MKDWQIPIVEDESVPQGVAFLLPQVRPVLYIPPEGFTSLEARWYAELDAITEAYVQAAKRGEVGIVQFDERGGK